MFGRLDETVRRSRCSTRSVWLLVFVALAVAGTMGCRSSKYPDIAANTPNPPHIMTVASELLGETRRVYVQLPEGYESSETRYPVLVVLDGEWLFELARAHVRFFSKYDVMDVNIPKMIVIGIENTDRDRNFTPTEKSGDENEFPTAGEADLFLEFLDTELLPLLDRKYRTAPSRTVAGWSFGGLLAMYAAVAKPDLFDAHLCISPAIWWDDDYVFEKYRDARLDVPKRMVITLGANEAGGGVYTSTKRIQERFQSDPIPNLSVIYLEFEGVGHSWGIPAAFDKGLQRLWSGFLAPSEVSGGSMEEVTTYYQNLSVKWGFHVDPPVPVMQNLALVKWDGGEKDEAIGVIDHLLTYEPNASLALYYKGRFQFLLERPEEALATFREGLEAESRRDVPKGVTLRLFHETILEVEGDATESAKPG